VSAHPRRRAAGRAGVAAVALLLAAVTVAARFPGWPSVPAPRSVPRIATRDTLPVSPVRDSAPLATLDGQTYVAANDLARLIDAVKFWRADVRKLVLRSGRHRITINADNPFVVLDQRTLRLPAEARLLGGEMQIPIALVDSLPRDSAMARLFVEPRQARVVVLPPGGLVRGPQSASLDSLTRWTFLSDRPEEASVASRARGRFRLRFTGYFSGTLPESLPPRSLVRAGRRIGSVSGSAIELQISPEAVGYRLIPETGARRLVLEFWRAPRADLEAFAPEVRPAAGGVRVVVLDAGHGGGDPGVRAGGLAEKDLTLALVRRLREELGARGLTHVLLTRDEDRTLSNDQRAEYANHARADLYLSLHVDGFTSPQARGITILCPPARFGGTPLPPPPRVAPISVMPWRDVAERHAVQSLALAEVLRSTLELNGLGPVRLREMLPTTLIGVDATGLMIECGELTSSAERARLADPASLSRMAALIADGVLAWERSE